MGKEEIRKLFCAKISMEIRRFKQEILWKDKEQIYENAFRIDCMINIYELLLEFSQEKGEQELKKLLDFPKLLAFLYDRWMKTEDSCMDELKCCMEQSMSEIEKSIGIEKGEREA